MTISAATAWGSAVGTGITGPYAIPFALYSQTDLSVLTFSNDMVTKLNLGTDYTFTAWSPDNKGYVGSPAITFTNAVAGGVLIVFLLALPGTQNTAISNYAPYFPSLSEMTFDRLAQMTLQLLEWAKKTAKCPDYEQGGTTNQTMPSVADRASKLAGWDGSGNLTAMLAVPSGSVSFTTTGQLIAQIASIAALLQLLGIFVVANQAGLSGISVLPNVLNLAYEQDTGVVWVYNAIDNGSGSAGWNKLATVGP